jgi:hypothetical protein
VVRGRVSNPDERFRQGFLGSIPLIRYTYGNAKWRRGEPASWIPSIAAWSRRPKSAPSSPGAISQE